MTQHDDLPAIAAQLALAWETGRICPHVGGGARVLALGRLADEGRLTREDALQLAREVEGIAFCFSPLPETGHAD